MVKRRSVGRAALIAVCAVALVGETWASADDPRGALAAAVERTGTAKTAHLALRQTTRSADRQVESDIEGALAHGDQDLTTRGDGGESRRVAVGTQVYERRPNAPQTAWLVSTRPAPTLDAAFGPLTLRDGTSLGDPKLYRTVADAGTELLPQGSARKITAELDMSAVAAAMQASADDAARLARMSGAVTVWITTADGRVARHVLTLVVPTASGPTTIESTADLTSLDAPLTIARP